MCRRVPGEAERPTAPQREARGTVESGERRRARVRADEAAGYSTA